MELTYKERDDGSAKNTSTEGVLGSILLLPQLRRVFPLRSLGSVMYPLSLTFQSTISCGFFFLQPFFFTLPLSFPNFCSPPGGFVLFSPGTHPVDFNFFISGLVHLPLCTDGAREGRRRWEMQVHSPERCFKHVRGMTVTRHARCTASYRGPNPKGRMWMQLHPCCLEYQQGFTGLPWERDSEWEKFVDLHCALEWCMRLCEVPLGNTGSVLSKGLCPTEWSVFLWPQWFSDSPSERATEVLFFFCLS